MKNKQNRSPFFLLLFPLLIGSTIAILSARSSSPIASKNQVNDFLPPPSPLCSGRTSLKFEDLPEAQLLSGIGNSRWEISTTSDSAQLYFNQGINALHAFWDVEAFKAFKKGLSFDSDCALLHWGLAKSISQTAGELKALKKESMAKALALSAQAQTYERDFILAFQERSLHGLEAYKTKMETYIQQYPEQVEVQLFYASSLSSSVRSHSPEGIPTPGNIRGQEILQQILASTPHSSAANHYFIHALENGPTPQKALHCAKRIASLAPASGHLTHMPGHIYYRIGEYDKAITCFHQSLRVDSTYMANFQMDPINNWNYTHNIDYLVASYAENGQYQTGLKWATRLSKLSIDKSRSMSGGSGYILFGAYTAIPRFHLRFEEWEKAYLSLDSLLDKIPWYNSKAIPYLQGVKKYAEGMHHFHLGQLDKAAADLEKLKDLKVKLETDRPEISADWYFRYATKILAVNAQELEALIDYKKGNVDKAIEQLMAAQTAEKNIGYWEPPHYTRPVSESLAWVYTQERNLDKAKETYAYSLQLRPRNGHSQFALARAVETLGNDPKATVNAYRIFLTYWGNGDDVEGRVSKARAYVEQYSD